MIHRYLKWSETANYNIKKNNSRNQNLQGSTMGGGQGSTIISRTHSRTLEFTPRGVPILDTSYLRVCCQGVASIHTSTCKCPKRKTRMPAVSPPPEGSTTDFPFFFGEICFSLWFRSDALSVSPEPELQIHCVFQGFLFLFSNVLFFRWKVRFF